MHGKTVVVVEDEEPKRRSLGRALERRGFRVRGVGTVSEARRVIRELGETTDVMLLDMRLDDPAEPATTGADIAIEARDENPLWMPEYLIVTAYPNVTNYYQLALRLGAAAYLSRAEVTQEETVRHIRALALKRALRVERPSVMAALGPISESTKNLSDAVTRFCREMLMGELDACLGSPYILLLTNELGTQNVATNTDLPTSYGASYAAIQSMAQAITKLSSFHVVTEHDLKVLPAPVSNGEERFFARLPGAALLPLANVMNFSLSLVLLAPRPMESRHPEETGPLAAALAQHVRPSIIEHFLKILVHIDSKKKAVLKNISYFCLYVGQEQQRIINEGVVRGELHEGSEAHLDLRTMADDLRQTGAVLSGAASYSVNDALPTLEVRGLIERELEDLKELVAPTEFNYRLEGSCRIRANEDINIAFKRLLHWLVQRYIETPPALNPEISVRCVEGESESLVVFEDRSERLSKELRRQLFEPFSTSVMLGAHAGDRGPGIYLPLYLAKVLVEEQYGGRLTDESDQMGGGVGHRLVLRLSPPAGGFASDDMGAVGGQ